MKADPPGAEAARVELAPDHLRATGIAIGSHPGAYRLDYELETTAGFVTRRVTARAQGDRWSRRLELTRSPRGAWAQDVTSEGDLDLPQPGGDLSQLTEALDPDLGLSPLFNTMPVLRAKVHEGGSTHDFLMAWISVPDLSIHPSPQRYTYVETRSHNERVVRFEAVGDAAGFVAEIVFDADGLVVDYPGIASRIPGA